MHEQKRIPLQHLLFLFKSLNREGIRYCHWKSNVRLEKAMSGLTDLDLLVDRCQAERFRGIVGRFNFKPMRSPANKQYPAIEDYLGFDPTTGCLSHLHVHYRLVLGNQYVKRYCLPLEDFYLTSSQFSGSLKVPVPMPEWELVMLITRILLKTRNRVLLGATFKSSPPIQNALQAEIAYLLDQVDSQKLETVLDEFGTVVSREIVETFLNAWEGGFLKPLRLFRLRYRLRRKLAPYTWCSWWRSLRYYLYQELQSRWPWRHKPRKQMTTGGVTIAFVGADGAGKSTVVGEIQRWLNWKQGVQTFYMGSKQPSWISRCIKKLFVNSNRLHRVCVSLFDQAHIPARLTIAVRGFFESLNSISLAMDRHRRFWDGYRAARRGEVVLFDRFPLPEVYEFMDGPRNLSTEKGRFRKLAFIERRFYRAIARPDHLVIFHVSPEVALSRKPDHNPEVVAAKSTALKNLLGENNTQITHVDADVPLEQVLLKVKKVVWGLM